MRAAAGTILMIACLALGLGMAPPGAGAQGQALRGWLSDEQCARIRATSGVYTGTNPDCAKKCVAKGVKVVLIATDQKEVLNIANPEAAKKNIGDYVEVTGNIDQKTKTLHIDSLKMLTRGRATYSPPQSKK